MKKKRRIAKVLFSLLLLAVLSGETAFFQEPVVVHAANNLGSSSTPAEGDYKDFAYTGGMQSFTAPVYGIYKLEVYGGAGGNGGAGGYSIGYIILDRGTTLYVCCGGYNPVGGGTYHAGGYNGGGDGRGTDTIHVFGGGGATHIAMKNGTLRSLGYTYATSVIKAGEVGRQLKGVLIVAGGGGAGTYLGQNGTWSGGNGGGSAGGWGKAFNSGGSNRPVGASGTQTAAGINGHTLWADTNNDANNGGFGYGGSAKATVTTNVFGGGGGWYGGGVGYAPEDGHYAGTAGGGSGYIGGVPEFTLGTTTYSSTTKNGVNSASAGKAKITLIKKLTTITNDTSAKYQNDKSEVNVNATEIENITGYYWQAKADGASWTTVSEEYTAQKGEVNQTFTYNGNSFTSTTTLTEDDVGYSGSAKLSFNSFLTSPPLFYNS